MKLIHKLAILGVVIGTLFAIPAFAIFLPYQGGTGTGLNPASGSILIGTGSSTYTPAFLSAGGGIQITNSSGTVVVSSTQYFPTVATTTINSQQCPSFTFSINATTSASSYTASSCTIFLNLLYYSSSSQITVTTTGTILFASNNISQFTNNSNYLTGNQSISLTGPVTGSGATSIATTIVSPLVVTDAQHTTIEATTSITDAGTLSVTQTSTLKGNVSTTIATGFVYSTNGLLTSTSTPTTIIPPSMALLASSSVTSAVTGMSVNIPSSTYLHVVAYIGAGSSGQGIVEPIFNNDSSSANHYSMRYGVNTFTLTSATSSSLFGSGSFSSFSQNIVFDVGNATSTGRGGFITISDSTTTPAIPNTYQAYFNWATSTVITSIQMNEQSGNIPVGSYMEVFGY